MTYKVIAIAILSVFLSSLGFGAENIYTWKDKHGVLNITDQTPPSGAKIIEISPSYRSKAEALQRNRAIRLEIIQKGQERQNNLAQLTQLKRVEQEAVQTAEESMKQANALISRSNRAQDWERSRKLRSKALRFEKKMKEALATAEKAKAQAEMLEGKLASLPGGSL